MVQLVRMVLMYSSVLVQQDTLVNTVELVSRMLKVTEWTKKKLEQFYPKNSVFDSNFMCIILHKNYIG